MASSREYWAKRFEMLHEAELAKGEGLVADLEIIHRQTAAAIEADLAKWYARFAVNNEVDMATAKQMLTSGELAELRWDVEDYIKAGKQNALDQSWLKELENASDKVHISRLEALMMQMQQHVEVFYGSQLDKVDTLLSDIYKSGYYHTAFEVQKGVGVGWSLQSMDDKQVSSVLSKPWTADGKTFSDRIWTAKADMIDTLHRELTQSIVRGDDPKKVIKTIAEDYNVSKAKAGRLVMTESAFVSTASQKDAFESMGVEQYEIVATLDNKTSSICQGLDGKVFDMSDFAPGHTAPPFHVWCRSVTAPHFEDEDGYRAARGRDGKTTYVPADMRYKEWYNEHVKTSEAPTGVGDWVIQNGRYVPSEIRSDHASTPKKYTANSIVEHHKKSGQIDRDFYDSNGWLAKQVHSGVHGNPKTHQLGEHGEHAHVWIFNENGKVINRDAIELSADDREKNSDILER